MYITPHQNNNALILLPVVQSQLQFIMRRRLPLSTLTVLSGPIEMLKLESPSSDPPLFLNAAPWDLLRSGLITSHVAPPSEPSCCISCKAPVPLRPRDLGDFGGGGGTKIVANCAILRGSDVIVTGIGKVSISEILSSGSVERSEVGRSVGESARTTWRRWTLEL